MRGLRTCNLYPIREIAVSLINTGVSVASNFEEIIEQNLFTTYAIGKTMLLLKKKKKQFIAFPHDTPVVQIPILIPIPIQLNEMVFLSTFNNKDEVFMIRIFVHFLLL